MCFHKNIFNQEYLKVLVEVHIIVGIYDPKDICIVILCFWFSFKLHQVKLQEPFYNYLQHQSLRNLDSMHTKTGVSNLRAQNDTGSVYPRSYTRCLKS